jgi:hypothetical protein
MGRSRIVFDPSGYKRCDEPGAQFAWDAGELAALFRIDPDRGSFGGLQFIDPAGLNWLLPQPRQFSPTWYADVRLGAHVLHKDLWTWGAGVQVHEWQPTRVADGTTFPQNKWLTLITPATITALDTMDYGAMGQKAGVSLAGMKTIGFCGQTPHGHNFTNLDYTPHLQYAVYPEPNATFVFGFYDFAWLFSGNSIYLLRTPDNSKQTWELLDKWAPGAKSFGFAIPQSTEFQFRSFTHSTQFHMQNRAIMAMVVGLNHLVHGFHEGGLAAKQIRSLAVSGDELIAEEPFFKSGAWYIGAFPGSQHISLQPQIVGYEEVSTTIVAPGPRRTLFDTSEDYKPTETLAHKLYILMHATEASDVITEVDGDSRNVHRSTTTGEKITWQIEDEAGNGFLTDGTNHTGTFYLKLTPGASGVGASGGYFASQVSRYELKFPVKLVDRARSQLILDDSKWARWRVSTSVATRGKRFSVDIPCTAADELYTSGLLFREDLPVHIEEEVQTGEEGGQPVYSWVVRAACWVDTFTAEMLWIRPSDTIPPTYPEPGYDPIHGQTMRLWGIRVHGKGVLVQCDSPPFFPIEITDPDGDGHVEVRYALKQALLMSGINADDPAKAKLYEDLDAGTSLARFGGTWPTKFGEKTGNEWSPDPDEPWINYIERIAEYRGWLCYERLNGQVVFHPDLMYDMARNAGQYYASATIYRSHSEAAAAGAPDQCMLVHSQLTVRPVQANVIRLVGKAAAGGETPPTVIDQDLLSLTDTAYENFVGRRKVYAPPTPKLAVDASSLSQIARTMRYRKGRRGIIWQDAILLAPWEMVRTAGVTEPVEVAYVLKLKGRPDDGWWITDMEVECQKSSRTDSLFRTTFTAEKLPAAAAEGAPGAVEVYPGYTDTEA